MLLVSKPPDLLGFFCFLRPGSVLDPPSLVVSSLMPGSLGFSVPSELFLVGTVSSTLATPGENGLFGKIRAVSIRSCADCSASDLLLAVCCNKADERSARVLEVLGGAIPDSLTGVCMLGGVFLTL